MRQQIHYQNIPTFVTFDMRSFVVEIDNSPNGLNLDAMESVASAMTIAFPKTGPSFINRHTSNSVQNQPSLLDQQLVFVVQCYYIMKWYKSHNDFAQKQTSYTPSIPPR